MTEQIEKETVFREFTDICGVNFRFYHFQGTEVDGHRIYTVSGQQHGVSNSKLCKWTFEWWKCIPGDPLKETGGSARFCMGLPYGIMTKDDAVEWVLFESDFTEKVFGRKIRSYEELDFALAVIFGKSLS